MGLFFNTISQFLYNRAKGWLILIILGISIFLNVFILPFYYSFHPYTVILNSLYNPRIFSPGEIFSVLKLWGEMGQHRELWLHLSRGVISPVLGFLLIGLIISWLFQRGSEPDSKVRTWNLIALCSVFDLLENIFIIILILMHPDKSVIATWLKITFTSAKYIFIIPVVLVFLYGLIKAAGNRFKIQA